MALRAVLFDIDDTLFSTTRFAKAARTNAVRAMVQAGLDLPEELVLKELEEVVSEFTSNYDHHYDQRHGEHIIGRRRVVDQPLLHPRPHARKKLRQMVRRPWHLAVHGQLEVG